MTAKTQAKIKSPAGSQRDDAGATQRGHASYVAMAALTMACALVGGGARGLVFVGDNDVGSFKLDRAHDSACAAGFRPGD